MPEKTEHGCGGRGRDGERISRVATSRPVVRDERALPSVRLAEFRLQSDRNDYDWTAGDYVTPTGFEPTTTTSCDVTLALGLPGRLDIDLVAPLAMKEQGSDKSSGMGDAMVYARWGVLQSSLLPVRAALLLGANLPTASADAKPALGDRTTDVALAVSANTQKLGPFLGHARLGYWLNGKTDDTTKVGNMVEYVLCGDYSISGTLTPELALSGFMLDKKQVNGTAVESSQASQHSATLLLMVKPISMLTIRPKAGMPLAFLSEGGSLPSFTVGLDVWAFVP